MLGCFADTVNGTSRRFFPNLWAMPDLADLERRLDAMPRGARTRLADALDLDVSTVSKIFKGKRQLKAGELEVVENFLGQDSDGSLPGVPHGYVPLYGFVAASGGMIGLTEGRVLRHIPMHPAQAGYARIGAAEVIGESMFPRYRPREIVYFVFDLTPPRGDDAVIEMTEGNAILKEFASRKDGHIFLREYFPEERQISVREGAVKGLHAVVGRG